jgi:alkenylglycerophosphocholine/alkenylglycerophosphoethanolamine hydrolase
VRARIIPFIPFVIVSLVHLGALLVDSGGAVSTVTKPFLMPALLFAVLWCLRLRVSELFILAVLGVVFSFLGDVLLQSPGDIGFLLGLGGFLLAHVAYLLLFARSMRERRIPWFAWGYAIWWAVFIVYLAPYVGALLIPVALYGLVLGASALFAAGASRLAAIGALVFLVSDTLLALKLFVPGYTFYPVDFIIMILYISGQGLIAYAVAVSDYRSRSQPES